MRLAPARAISCCPAQDVTPAASSPSLTTNSVAMKITVGSPKPPSASSRSSTPVAHSASATPSGDDRDRQPSQTNTATAAPRMMKVIVASLMSRCGMAPDAFVSTGRLPPPEIVQDWVDEAHARYRTNAEGEVSTVYPALADAPPH